mmetsp:Transcript_9362/g.57070  ORF Transcript_9362/g.57070 Transcript_9362/m.57070 type:complete len:209 (+) Transcript_9362:2632-3258(+)
MPARLLTQPLPTLLRPALCEGRIAASKCLAMHLTILAISYIQHRHKDRSHSWYSHCVPKKVPIPMQRPDGMHASMLWSQSLMVRGTCCQSECLHHSCKATLFPKDIVELAPPTAKQSRVLAEGPSTCEQHLPLKPAQTLDEYLLLRLQSEEAVHLPWMLQPESAPQHQLSQANLPLPWKVLPCKFRVGRMLQQVLLKRWASPTPPGQH